MSDNDESVRLTYGELAQARGISLESAKRLVLRRSWPRQIGNDGLTKISVPRSSLPPNVVPDTAPNVSDDVEGDVRADVSDDVRGDIRPIINGNAGKPTILAGHDSLAIAPTDSSDIGPDISLTIGLTTSIEVLKTAVGSLQEQLTIANQRADNAERRADSTERRNTELQAMLDAEIAERRRIVAALIEKLPAPAPPMIRRSWWRWGRG
jgi:hypothetical protein